VITIYTDGAASGNPGPGAYCTIVMLQLPDYVYQKIYKRAYRRTTNNRMELWAIIAGLEALKRAKQQVEIYSDSRYVVDAINKGWLLAWIEKDFEGKKNDDLWKRFCVVYQQHSVTLKWIKGHANNTYNKSCDRLAAAAAKEGPWEIDEVYERKF
jgi:ribonuclease HI